MDREIWKFQQLLSSQPPTSHIPPAIFNARMETISAYLYTLVTKLFDQVHNLPVPSVAGIRIKLPCLSFKLGRVSLVSQNGSKCTFRAQTNTLGVVEIRTEEDLSRFASLHLVHPWIDFFLDRQPLGSRAETTIEEKADQLSVLGKSPSLSGSSSSTSTTQKTRTAHFIGRLGRTFSRRSITSPATVSLTPLSTACAGGRSITPLQDTASLSPPSTVSLVEKEMHVLQFVARLRQPFGALLLTQTRRNVEEYKRIASESLIRVQIEEIAPTILDKLIHKVRILDVL